MGHEHDNGKPDPACILAMSKLVQETASATADRVEKMLTPVIARISTVEGVINGNGKPGLAEEVRMLKRIHDDYLWMRRTLALAFLGNAVVLLGYFWWTAQWVEKVNHHMSATATMESTR